MGQPGALFPVLPMLLLLLVMACGPDGNPPGDDTGPPADTGDTGIDADGDGWRTPEDCDDADPAVHPGATETCDGIDEDCDGTTDEDAEDAGTWYPDTDGDGYGDAAAPTVACDQPPDTLSTGGDCDDGNALVHPGATEVCDNGLDDDCDPESDWACRWYGVHYLEDLDPALYGDAGVHSGLGSDLAAMEDWTGDGGSDIAIAAKTGGVALFEGRPASVDDAAGHVVGLGTVESVNGLGDLDADGVAELGVVGSVSGATTLSVLLGPLSPGDHDVADLARLVVEGGNDPATGGDLTGDGAPDLAFGVSGDLVVLSGPIAGGSATASDAAVLVAIGAESAQPARTGGDVSGDGSADLMLVADSEAVVFMGPVADGTLTPTDADLRVALTHDMWISVLDGGDTNGDGTDDLLVGDALNSDFRTYQGRVGYFFGGPGLAGHLTSYDSDAAFYGEIPTNFLGRRIVGCDIDGDGLSDTLGGLGRDGDTGGSHGMAILYGPPEGNAYSDANWRPESVTGVEPVGMQVACGGDLDDDGPEEFLLGGWLCYGQGSVWLFEGMGR